MYILVPEEELVTTTCCHVLRVMVLLALSCVAPIKTIPPIELAMPKSKLGALGLVVELPLRKILPLLTPPHPVGRIQAEIDSCERFSEVLCGTVTYSMLVDWLNKPNDLPTRPGDEVLAVSTDCPWLLPLASSTCPTVRSQLSSFIFQYETNDDH
jgi:hypothetical protein